MRRTSLVYEYDGSFDGLLCCVFESYHRREIPLDILPAGEATLFPVREIGTDAARAERVYRALPKKLGPEAEELVSRAYLYGLPGKELAIYRFLRMGFRLGPDTVRMLGEEAVSRVQDMARAVGNEAHLMTEFLRFSERGGALIAKIEPKHWVLPLMADHFRRRFAEERFLIWDKCHGMALLYQPYEMKLVPAEELELPEEDERERFYQRLWKGYYDVIGIGERENPRCRMSHMPKRFWGNMTEMKRFV